MFPRVPFIGQQSRSAALYRRPSRLRRWGPIALGASGVLAVACGGGSDKPSEPDAGQVWVQGDAANGRINLDDVQQAYRDAYKSDGFKVEEFEKRVNEIYEGDNIVLIEAVQNGDKMDISGWEDLNGNKALDANDDDKLFTISQELKDGGGFTTQGHGSNNYYHSSNPFGGFLTGLLIGNLISGGFGGFGRGYVTSPGRYDDINSARTSYRNSGGYSTQQQRNSGFGSGVSSRFGSAASTEAISPARQSYQSRQINSGGFRSSGSSSRSIGSGKGVSGGGSTGGLQGGGGMMAL